MAAKPKIPIVCTPAPIVTRERKNIKWILDLDDGALAAQSPKMRLRRITETRMDTPTNGR
jgi:hypothetical protein